MVGWQAITMNNALIFSEASARPVSALSSRAEQELVTACLGGDEGAFGQLVRQHERRVFRLVGRFYHRREDIEEVAQETFLLAWRKLDTYRGEAPVEHWLTRICLNCCYGRLRRKTVSEEPFEADVEAPRRDPDAKMEVEGLLRQLSPQDRFILSLLDGEGWSVSEIADRLGWTRVNVKVRAHRARKKLRRILEQELDS
ncbi:MAG: sigma-70 family RNA polymerase sigma factor [Deltaproteobacteria bacterium]|nr:sigma-70 family RNA polymerase sigma factor [Deltaproteobacteria bacterium]